MHGYLHFTYSRFAPRISGMFRCGGVVLCVLLFFAACSSAPEPEAESSSGVEAPLRLGMLVSMNSETPFFIQLVRGAHNAAALAGAELEVKYAADDLEAQVEQFQAMLDNGVDAILLNPVSPEIAGQTEKARRMHIPVVVFDRDLGNATVSSTVTSDNEGGGAMAGNHLAELLQKKGRVVELKGTPGSSAALLRGRGFGNALERYPNLVVAGAAVGNFNREGGRRACEQLAAEHPDLDGVFAHNDDMALGCLKALRAAGKAENVLVIGFDAVDEAVDEVERGGLAATIAQRPSEIGRLSVENAVKAARGEPVTPLVFVDLALIIR